MSYIEEKDVPVLILLKDNLQWLLTNQDASNVILEELKSQTSRVFFLAIEPEEDLESIASPSPSLQPSSSFPPFVPQSVRKESSGDASNRGGGRDGGGGDGARDNSMGRGGPLGGNFDGNPPPGGSQFMFSSSPFPFFPPSAHGAPNQVLCYHI